MKIIFPILLLWLYARLGILKAFREDLLDLPRLRSSVQIKLILFEVNSEVRPPSFTLATPLSSYGCNMYWSFSCLYLLPLPKQSGCPLQHYSRDLQAILSRKKKSSIMIQELSNSLPFFSEPFLSWCCISLHNLACIWSHWSYMQFC